MSASPDPAQDSNTAKLPAETDANKLHPKKAAKLQSTIEALTQKYEEELNSRKSNRDSEPVKQAKLAVLNALTSFEKGSLTAAKLRQRLELIDAINKNKHPNQIIEKLTRIKNDITPNTDNIKFARKSFFRTIVDTLLYIFQSQPRTHFHDTLNETKKILQAAQAELSSSVKYTRAEIDASKRFTPEELTREVNDETKAKALTEVVKDLLRNNAKLEGHETAGKSEAEVTAAIAKFTEGHEAVKDFISKTASQTIVAGLEKELVASYALPAGFVTLTKTSKINWEKDGDKFFCRVELTAQAAVKSDGSQRVYAEADNSEIPRLASFETQEEAEEFATRLATRATREAIDPILTASMLIELEVDPATNTVKPKVNSLEVTSYVLDLHRAEIATYSPDQIKKVDLDTDKIAEAKVSPDKVLPDFERDISLTLILPTSPNPQKINISQKEGEKYSTRVERGIKALTGEKNLSSGYAQVIASTKAAVLAQSLTSEIRAVIPGLAPPKETQIQLEEMNWKLVRGELYCELSVKVLGVFDPATKMGQVVNPSDGSLTTVKSREYKGLVDPKSETTSPAIAEAKFVFKYVKDAAGFIQPPKLDELSIVSQYPKAYPITPPSMPAAETLAQPEEATVVVTELIQARSAAATPTHSAGATHAAPKTARPPESAALAKPVVIAELIQARSNRAGQATPSWVHGAGARRKVDEAHEALEHVREAYPDRFELHSKAAPAPSDREKINLAGLDKIRDRVDSADEEDSDGESSHAEHH